MQSTSEWTQQQTARVAQHVAEALACLARAREHLTNWRRIYGRA